MARHARIKPREGMIVPMPSGLDLPPEGASVDIDDLFWQRRLADGDVILADEPTEPETSRKGR